MRHRLHYVGKNREFEDLGQETITLADIATEEEDDMINPAAVVALKGNDGNEMCADCQTLEPDWASISFGSFICLRCAAHHRSLGVNVSKVRSVTLDRWTVEEVRRMQAGGNAELRLAFCEAGIPSDLSIQEKYQTSTAEAYCAKVEAYANNRPPPAFIPPYIAPPPKRLSTNPESPRSDTEIDGLTPLEFWHRKTYGCPSNASVWQRCRASTKKWCDTITSLSCLDTCLGTESSFIPMS